MRRRFEKTHADRQLFWEIEKLDKCVVVSSGTTGKQPKIEKKTFQTAQRTIHEFERLLTLKRREGFEEVSILRHYRAEPTETESVQQEHWTKVMCLTGVDYFSTLGYQPGIAFLAAGILSPLATLLVVIVTLLGLVPLYSRVAEESPFGQGSIAMLEKLLAGWRGKALVLVLLGFAATDFVITITLSAADAAAHLSKLPAPWSIPGNSMHITLALLTLLGLVFLKGFREAIGLSLIIVCIYIGCNCVLIARCLQEIATHPELITNWSTSLVASFHTFPNMLGLSLIMFPRLALGMSGFETGVAVMPLVRGDSTDRAGAPLVRIANTKKLLIAAALIMAVGLLFSSLVTTLLIQPALFHEGAPANGRALSYLAQLYMPSSFCLLYDLTTACILWFAGASALAGLLTLVPRYLPKYGMAPDWARSRKPLVVFFTLVSWIVTIIFNANVDSQAGAYATGVLVLMTSAAFAVVLCSKHDSLPRRLVYLSTFVVLLYTTGTNIVQRPEGLQIGAIFIGVILLVSLISRSMRSLELRIKQVELDGAAADLLKETLTANGRICLLAHRPSGTPHLKKEAETREIHMVTEEEADFLFLEIDLGDPSDFAEETLRVAGHREGRHGILRCTAAAIPNAIAAIALHIRDVTKVVPVIYFNWTEGHPLAYVLKYIFLGEGETAPLTREILREVDKDEQRRPRVIVG